MDKDKKKIINAIKFLLSKTTILTDKEKKGVIEFTEEHLRLWIRNKV